MDRATCASSSTPCAGAISTRPPPSSPRRRGSPIAHRLRASMSRASTASGSRSRPAPVSLLLHALLLAAVLYHVVTWFQTLPKTLPKLILDGKQVPPQKITQIATLAAGACSLVLLLFTLWVAR